MSLQSAHCPVTVKSLYECQLYHLHREDEVNSHNGVGVMVGVEVGGDGGIVGCFLVDAHICPL